MLFMEESKRKFNVTIIEGTDDEKNEKESKRKFLEEGHHLWTDGVSDFEHISTDPTGA